MRGYLGWHRGWGAVLLALVLGVVSSAAARGQGKGDEAAIRTALEAQVAAWNKGDVSAFMAGYENSPDTTFVGSDAVHKGFQPILERYKKSYATPEEMGTLTFQDLDVRLLPGSSGVVEFAVVTGKFHLARSVKGDATKDDGIFSLVWRKTGGVWKIVLDHTS